MIGFGFRVSGSGFLVWCLVFRFEGDLHLGAGVLRDLDDGVHNVLALVHPGAANWTRHISSGTNSDAPQPGNKSFSTVRTRQPCHRGEKVLPSWTVWGSGFRV